jgi:trehalose 6-phosphate synthase
LVIGVLSVCSHRGPLTYASDQDGMSSRSASGGLVAVLGPLLENMIDRWTAAPMSAADRMRAQGPQSGLVHFVDIPADLHQLFYDTACVTGLGFLFHRLFDTAYTPLFDSKFMAAWDAYIEVNRRYASSVVHDGLSGPVLVEDYHLMALANQIRSIDPLFQRTIAYFHHVPWCPPAVFRLLPQTLRHQVLTWLLAFDTIGFHARAWADEFVACCDSFLPGVRCDSARISWRGREVRLEVAPAQIAASSLRTACSAESVLASRACIERWADGRPLLIRVDRVDLWKNIIRGFTAFEEYVRSDPFKGQDVRFVAVLATSRTHLQQYRRYFDACQAEAERINQALSGGGPQSPIQLVVDTDRDSVLAYLSAATAVLANSTSDGLNIVPKEAVVAGEGGPRLILSQNMGVYEEIGQWAIGVDPYDIRQTAEAIGLALHSSPHSGVSELRAAVAQNDPQHWVRQRLGQSAAPWPPETGKPC